MKKEMKMHEPVRIKMMEEEEKSLPIICEMYKTDVVFRKYILGCVFMFKNASDQGDDVLKEMIEDLVSMDTRYK
jgi:hypothetical protein